MHVAAVSRPDGEGRPVDSTWVHGCYGRALAEQVAVSRLELDASAGPK
jgi:hypothetical protein